MIYLNNAATTYPKPPNVIKAIQQYLEQIPGEPGRDNRTQTQDVLLVCRQQLAQLFQINDLSRIILTTGSTMALNYVIHGLLAGHSDTHCISSVLEHNSVIRPLNHLQQAQSLKITWLTLEQLQDPDKIVTAIKKNTRLCVLNHISNVTGMLTPIKKIAHICAEHDIPCVIDASQSAGSVDINVQELPANIILIFTGHKGLMGPMGTGGFYLGTDIAPFEPFIQGGTGVRSDLLVQPNELPMYYEAGTMNLPGFAGLSRGVEYIHQVGVSRIQQHKQRLFQHLLNLIEVSDRFLQYEPLDCDYSGGVFSFNIRGWAPDEVGVILRESFGIIVRSGLHCAPLIHQEIGSYPTGTVRLSSSWFTTQADIEQTARAINLLLRSK